MPKITISDLDRELRNKQLRPVYFIYGPESYLINTALARIKSFIAAEPDRFSAKSSSPADIIACATTTPMFAVHRLVIVSEADSIKDAEQFAGYFAKPSKTATIVFVAEKADGRTKFLQVITEAGGVVECKPLYDDKIPDWVRMEASRLGKNISMEAAGMIAELVGNSLGELAGALDKIILYIGAKSIIEAQDVETVLSETSRKNVFEFTDAVGHKNLQKAFHALRRLAEFNESEIMVLSMLSRHWRILLKAREALAARADKTGMARLLGVNPFFVDNYLSQAKLFSGTELKAGFKKLYTTDKLLKSSRLPKVTILQRCVRELIEN